MQNCTFLKDLGLKKHKVYFFAVGSFIEKWPVGNKIKGLKVFESCCANGENYRCISKSEGNSQRKKKTKYSWEDDLKVEDRYTICDNICTVESVNIFYLRLSICVV